MLLAQTKTGELTITTSSKPALALFEQAREKLDNAELTAAAPLLDQAIQKDPDFARADPESAYDLFYTAVAQERKGDKVEAARLYSKVAAWNQNNLGYAVVRSRAQAKKS